MSSKSKKDVYKKGDRVSARWAGSNVYYDAKVVDVTSRTYRVQFDDGSISSVKYSEVKKLPQISKESSPKATKPKSRSRSRSGGRTTRSRSRSPARRERRAPATRNEKKSSSKEEKSKTEVSSNSNSVSKEETDTASKPLLTREKLSLSKGVFESIKAPIVSLNSYSKELSVSVEKYEGTSERLRSSRLASLRSTEAARDTTDSKPSIELRNARKISEKAKYSDDEEEEEQEEESDEELVPMRSLSKTWQAFYFILTALRMILIPTSLLFLVFACTKKQCTVLDVPQFYGKWRDLGNAIKYPIGGILAYHLLHCILSFVPLGKKVTGFATEADARPLEYRLNGLPILLVNIIIFAACSYFGVYMNWGYDKFKGFALGSVLYCIVWAVGLHIYSLIKGGGTAQTKVPLLGKFYNGSYTNPFLFGKLDLKTSFIRTGLMGLVILNLSILVKLFLMKGYITVAIGLTSAMQIFFVLDLFAREEKLLSTATYTSDTFGYAFILTTGFLVPIGLALQNVYHFIFEAKSIVLPHYCSAGFVGLFIIGYYIYLTSTNLKHNFRRNPFSPGLQNVTSIPTSKKKRLIASGLWGRVRHPNYLGLLIMALAWTLPCGITHLVPYGPLILLTIALVVRSFRIENECKEKYGPAWTVYTQKVRSRLIPYIF